MEYYGTYPQNDYRYYLQHSAKGTTWEKKDHKYVKKEDGKYWYDNHRVEASKKPFGKRIAEEEYAVRFFDEQIEAAQIAAAKALYGGDRAEYDRIMKDIDNLIEERNDSALKVKNLRGAKQFTDKNSDALHRKPR